jgi:hypothetical protein
MRTILASLLLVACGTAEQAKLPELVVATPTPTPTAAPTPAPMAVEPPLASDVTATDNSAQAEANYLIARQQWKTCVFNAVFAACGRQPGGFSPSWERCKENNSAMCGSEPVLTDFQ